MEKKITLFGKKIIGNSILGFVFMFISVMAHAQNPGNCLNFNGASSYVKLPNGSINTKLTSGKVTIESWVLLNTYKPLATICKNWGNTPINGAFHFGMDAGVGNKLWIVITQDNNSTQPQVLSTDSLQLNKWYHVAFSADGSNLSLYINGKLQGSTTYNGTLLTTNQYTNIGVKPDGAGGLAQSTFAGYLSGSLDEFRIWNVGRTQAQINANMLDTISRNSSGLVAYYNFNQGVNGGVNTSINTLNDLTANAVTGQLNNFNLSGTGSNWIESYSMCVPVVLHPTNLTNTGFTANWSNPVVGVVDTFVLEVSATSTFASGISGSPFKLIGSINSKVISGLNQATKYYYRVSASKNAVSYQGLPFFVDSATTLNISTIITGDMSLKNIAKGIKVVVDNTLSITSPSTISGTNVTITSGKQTGDTLWYNGSLPAGVSANYNATSGVLTFTGNASSAQYEALLRTVTFRSLASSSLATRTIAFTLGTAVPYNGHFYEYVSLSSSSFTTAKSAASARSYFGLQGYLATVTSAAENNYIASKLFADAWMGASDEYSQINAATGATTYANQTASEGKWYWVTGPEKGTQFCNGNYPNTLSVGGSYINWNNGQPDNFINAEHYGQFYGSSVPAGRWNDLALTDLLNGYMCEYGGMPSDPTVILSCARDIKTLAPDAPQSISGLQLWLDASDINNTGTNPGNSTPITTWKDRSGLGNDADVLSGQNAGVLTSNQINGKSVVRFTRTSQFIGSVYDVPNVDIRAQNMPKVTLFTVYKQGAQTAPPSDQAIWGCDNGGWDRFFFSSFPSYSGGGNNPNNGGVSQGSYANVVTNAGVLNKTQLLTAIYDNQTPSGSGVYFNGQNIATFTDITTLSAAQTSLRIGFDGDDNCYNGDIAEMIVYNRKLTDCEIQTINKYLSNKYGVTFSTVSVDTSGPTNFYQGDSVVLSSSVNAATYQWLKNGSAISGATSKNYTAKQTGNYQVIVTNSCSDTSSVRFVNVISNNPPQTISGLQLWLDASDINNNGSNPSNGTSINIWKDRSGAGNDASVLSGQNAGVLSTNQINGKSVVNFTRTGNATGSVYDIPNVDIRPLAMPKMTIFTVYKQGAQLGGNQGVWGCDNGGWDRFFFSTFPSGMQTPDDGGVAQGTYANRVVGAGIVGKTRLLTAAYDYLVPKGSAVYFNGNTVATFGDSTNISNAQSSLRIGFDGDDNNFNGDIAEMIVYNRKLSYCEILTINKYLGNKYGVKFSSVGIDTSGSTTFRLGDSVILSANIAANAYQWLKNGSPVAGATSKNYTAKLPGNYQVVVVSSCSDTSLLKQVVVIPTPIVNTSSVSAITFNSATLGGIVLDSGSTAVTERGIVYSTTANPTVSNTKVAIGVGIGSFSKNIAGLNPATIYHVRAYAINTAGTSYGADSTFTTKSTPAIAPSVITSSASLIGITNATLGGNVTDSGTAIVTERGVVYATTANPTTANTKVMMGNGIGAFSQIITGLTPSTLYHFRAYAVNSVGISYGADSVFVTAIQVISAPTVSTASATLIGTTSATLGGNVSDSGTARVAERGIVFSTSTNPTISNAKVVIGAGLGSYSQNITLLSPNTTYHFRAYAINSVGTSYGADSSFTTLAEQGNVDKINNAFSPNGDGINDTWEIENASELKDHLIVVYNIFGQEVFSQTGYDKPWDGKVDGNPVPSAEYYYLIKGSKINKKGALLIKNN